MDQVMIEKTNKIMASGKTETTKTKKEEAKLTNDIEKLSQEELDMLKLTSDNKDLKDLYNNLVIENKGLTEERNELQAKTVELQSLLIDGSKENDEDIESLNMEVHELETDNAVLVTRIEETYVRVDDLKKIINKLIKA